MDRSRLIAVTLAFDNPAEAKKTIATVSLQTEGPDQFLVVDSSRPLEAEQIRTYALAAGARYVWVPAQAVYAAMNAALDLLADGDFVWFINSSDWLAGPGAMSSVRAAMGPNLKWAIGGLTRLGDKKIPHHPVPDQPSEFVRYLEDGRIGFPHPAAIMSVGVLRQVGGFNERFRIAADYHLALKVAKLVGPPHIVEITLAVHVPNGLTSKNKVRHSWEKTVARLMSRGWRAIPSEVSHYFRYLTAPLGIFAGWRQQTPAFPLCGNFGPDLEAWPDSATD